MMPPQSRGNWSRLAVASGSSPRSTAAGFAKRGNSKTHSPDSAGHHQRKHREHRNDKARMIQGRLSSGSWHGGAGIFFVRCIACVIKRPDFCLVI